MCTRAVPILKRVLTYLVLFTERGSNKVLLPKPTLKSVLSPKKKNKEAKASSSKNDKENEIPAGKKRKAKLQKTSSKKVLSLFHLFAVSYFRGILQMLLVPLCLMYFIVKFKVSLQIFYLTCCILVHRFATM